MKRKEGTSSSDPQSHMLKAANLPPMPNTYTGVKYARKKSITCEMRRYI
jgi:hypothetical protein